MAWTQQTLVNPKIAPVRGEYGFWDRKYYLLLLFLPYLCQLDVWRDDLYLRSNGLFLERGGELEVGTRQYFEAAAIMLQLGIVSFLAFVRGRLRLTASVANVSFLLLLSLNVLSALWSVDPKLTLLRSLEIISCSLSVFFYFSGSDQRVWPSLLARLLLVLLTIKLTDKMVSVLMVQPDEIDEAIRDNFGCEIAFALLLLVLMSWNFHSAKFRLIAVVSAVVSVLVFRSLTNTVSFISIGVLMGSIALFRRGHLPPLVTLVIAAVYVLFLTLFFAVFQDPLQEFVADLFGRTKEGLQNATGRDIIWRTAWEVIQENFFGLGFAAGERIILSDVLLRVNGFGTHAHNMFLSMLLSSGWLGLIAELVFIFSMFLGQGRLQPSIARICQSLILFELVSGISTPGFSGIWSVSHIVFCSILMASELPKARR